MAPPGLPLPSKEQCFALTDEQCHKILLHRDPDDARANKTWELLHQPELVRLYMTRISFPQIRDYMKSKLDYSYKTYANRYKDWHLPVSQYEREQTVRELFGLVSNSSNIQEVAATKTPGTPARLPIRPIQPQPASHLPRQLPPPQTSLPPLPQQLPPPQTSLPPLPPIASRTSHSSRPLHPPQVPAPPPPSQSSQSSQHSFDLAQDYFSPMRRQIDSIRSPTPDRMSIATMETWSTGSAQSNFQFDDTFSEPRYSMASLATTNSSLSSSSRFSQTSSMSRRGSVKPPKHDFRAGVWNDSLRVIPCGKNHSHLRWDVSFATCTICGFSQWHALMLQARSVDPNMFGTAMFGLRDVCKVDFAGNHTLHYLMSAGVGMEYFTHLSQWKETTPNVFGQNPLHVVDPQALGDELMDFVDWFKAQETPPGLLLTQRDIKGRTPLHCLLQRPLERDLYSRIFKVFPWIEHQLSTFDTSGRTAIMMMVEVAQKLKSESPADYQKMQAGIVEVKVFLSQSSEILERNRQLYGLHDIARGGRGTSYFGFYECRVCNRTNAHSNSYLDQLMCACNQGRDRNGPDDTGMTPAHAIVTQSRCNDDPELTPETPQQTVQLMQVLLPRGDPTLLETLRVLDGEGNSLIFNIATRGLYELLEYVLHLEEPARKRAMVNCCQMGPLKREWSVLAAVDTIRGQIFDPEKRHRFSKTKHVLQRYGAEMHPSITTRWQISWAF
ncbi:hypothetical protein LSUB1_G008903 [Lachnellula subtilissima]|uniref:Clr5 domain-containing protein n=1 Tax=Lachnellula subtilissima TaxID=602034 RepID=A0A8H8RAQ8_9HELO|nr:hypothetical protein LSUB1_G008903 [Lachnellula subtilissima]